MPDNIDSISIELTADISSAEESLNKLIGRLALLKVAVQGASNFTKIAGGIQRIAEAARKIETDSGEKLSNLAHGLMELSKVGDLSHLGSAAKNLSSVIKAASSSGNSANFGSLANGIRGVSDALGGITDSDVDRLGAVSDALSGETSGPIHTSSIGNESAEMGGGRKSFNTGGDMAAYGAMTVFKYVADSIRDATSAYHEFQAALGGGVPPVFTEFVDEARQSSEAMRQLSGGQNAMTVFKYVADNVRDASNAYREFAGLLGGGRVFTEFADDAERTVEALRMLPEGPNWRFGDTSESSTWVADEIRDASNAASDFGNTGSRSGAAIETEFTNLNSELNRTSGLFNNLKIGALNLGIVGVYLGSNLGTAIFNIAKGVAGLAAQIVRIGKYRLIRAMLKDMTQSFKDLYGWSKLYGTDFAGSMDTINTAFVYLRNSIAAMVAPLVNALAPALDFVIDKVVEVLNWFNQLFAALSGASTYTVAKKVAQSWGDSFDSTSGKAKKAADDIKRTILGFDEINKLTKQNENSSGSGSGSSPYSSGYTTMFEEKPLTGGFKGISDAMNTEIEDRLSQITSSIGKYELAIGALLVLSKANVPLGLGLMASGAAMMGSAIIANWDGISEQIKLVIGAVEAALGGGLAVGAILAFSGGHIGLGIGMMIAALSLEWGAVDIVWTTLKDKVGGQVQAIATLVGAATFGIGAVLAFAGHPGIGIPMMVAGASVTAAAINWNYLEEQLQGPIGAITAMISAATLVLGFVAISAGRIPLGVGLLVAGAAGLTATLAANWNRLGEYMEGPIGTITALVGAASLMLGFVAISAGRIPLGVGLLVAGAGELVTALAANWDRLKSYMEDPISAITTLVSAASLMLGFVAISAGRIPLGIGLLVAGAGGLVTALAANWNTLEDKIKVPIETVTGIISGAALVLGILAIVSGNVPLGLGLILSGAAGLANTITENWDGIKQIGIDAINKVKEGWDSVKKYFVLNIIPSTENQWLAGFLGINTASEVKKMEEEDAAAMQHAIEYAASHGITTPEISIKPVIDDTTWQQEWDEFVGQPFSVDTTVNANPGTGLNSSRSGLTLNPIATNPVSVMVSLVQNAWTTVSNWVNGLKGNTAVNQGIGLAKNAWTFVSAWVNTFMGNTAVNQNVSLTKIWTTVSEWVNGLKGNTQVSTNVNVNATAGTALSLGADNKLYVNPLPVRTASVKANAVGGNGTYFGNDNKIHLNPVPGKVTSVKANAAGGTGTKVSGGTVSLTSIEKGSTTVSVSAAAAWASTIGGLIPYLEINDLSTTIKALAKKDWQGTFKNKVGANDTSSTITAKLDPKFDTSDPLKSMNLKNLSTTIKVGLKSDGSKLKVRVSKGTATIQSATKRTENQEAPLALGGVFSNGRWSRIPQYAGGTTNAHGSLFLAGEAGPEIVGHVGGRTEVLNKSQLASAMYAAVTSAMAPASMNFAAAAANMNNAGDNNDDMDMLMDLVRRGSEATERQNELLRQQNDYLRSINDKDFAPEISTCSINKAQQRMNRRAGTTIVPVGT